MRSMFLFACAALLALPLWLGAQPVRSEGDHIFRLEAVRGGYSDEMVVGFYENAQDGFDNYDSEKMFASSDEYPQIYTVVEGHSLAINGYSFMEADFKSVTMGFNCYKDGQVVFTATTMGTFMDTLDVYLYDADADSLVDFRKQQQYAFSSTGTVETETRFELYFVDRAAHSYTYTSTGGWPAGTQFYDRITIAGGAHITVAAARQDARCKTLTLKPGAQLSVEGGLTVMDSLHIESATDGGACASLIGAAHLQVYGVTHVRRAVAQNRWWYFTPTVQNATAASAQAAAAGCHLYFWDETLNDGWTEITANTTTLPPLAGYAFYPENTGDTALHFTGRLQHGTIGASANLSNTQGNEKAGFNLVGNPYPSYIDLGTETSAPGITMEDLSATVWYRSNGNFYTYNRSGDGVAQEGASRYAAPGQAFWVYVENNTVGTFQVADAARTHATPGFLKHSPETLLRIFATHDNLRDELTLRFAPQAQAGYGRYDSPKKFTGHPVFPQLYAQAGGQPLSIAGQPLPPEGLTMPVGLRARKAGPYTLHTGDVPGALSGYALTLHDTQTGRSTDLREQPYTFHVPQAGDMPGRFSITLKKTTTAFPSGDANPARLYAQGGDLHVYKPGQSPAQLKVYSLQGKLLRQSPIPARQAHTVQALPQAPGLYIIQLITPQKQQSIKVIR